MHEAPEDRTATSTPARAVAPLHPVVVAVLLPPAAVAVGLLALLSGSSVVAAVLSALAVPLVLAVLAPAALLVGVARTVSLPPARRPEVVVPDDVVQASADLRATLSGTDPTWSPTVLRREAAVRLARGRLLQARHLDPPAPLDELLTLSHALRRAQLLHWEALQAAGGALPDEAHEALAREELQRESARLLRSATTAPTTVRLDEGAPQRS